MSQTSDRSGPGTGRGPEPGAVPTGTAAPADPDGGRHGRFHLPHLGRHDHGEPQVPTGLGASLATSGGLLLAMVEDIRMRDATEPEDLRPLADTFARHCAAKEATVRKVLVRHDVAVRIVERDRHEGELLQGILDRAVVGKHPEDTRVLTIDGALAQMYQYLFHERRDLVPAIEKAVPADESENLAAAFQAIADNE